MVEDWPRMRRMLGVAMFSSAELEWLYGVGLGISMRIQFTVLLLILGLLKLFTGSCQTKKTERVVVKFRNN